MVDGDLSLVKFNVINFYSLVLTHRPFQPITTILMKIVSSLLASEEKTDPSEETVKRLTWIKLNTHEKVLFPLAIVELAVFKNIDRGLSRQIEIDGKEFHLTTLYMYLDEIIHELTMIVIGIAKKYSIDLPFISMNNQQNKGISFG